MTMEQPKFGWRSVFSNYKLKDFIQDSIIPIILSITFCIVLSINNSNIIKQLNHLVEIGISIIPAMYALIIAAYTILLSFILGGKLSKITKDNNGKKLIKRLNSSFAACLFFTTISIIVLISSSIILLTNIKINIGINYCELLNYFAYFLISFLLFFSVSVLFGIIIDIYNCGQSEL